MSYEGRTSYAPRHAFLFTGQGGTSVFTAPPNNQMNGSWRAVSQKLEVRNIFNTNVFRLQIVYSGITNGSWHLEDSLNNANVHMTGWCMYDSNSTLDQRWYPPYSIGLVNSSKYIKTSYINLTSLYNNQYTVWEF